MWCLTIEHGSVGGEPFTNQASRVGNDEEGVPGQFGDMIRTTDLSQVRKYGGEDTRLMVYMEYLQESDKFMINLF